MLPTKFWISKKIFSVTAWPNESKFGRNHPWKVLYKECSFSSDPLTNMATTAILVSDWLISQKSSPLKPLGQMDRNFFRNQPIRNKNGLWWPCLITDQDEISNL
jgi:hypothetical protein